MLLFFPKRNLPTIFIYPWKRQTFYFLKKLFSTTFVTKVCVFGHLFLVMICKFVKKMYSLDFIETNGPIFYLGHGDAKSCVFRKKKYKTFVTKVCVFLSFVSFYDLKIREKNSPFSIYKDEWSNSYIGP